MDTSLVCDEKVINNPLLDLEKIPSELKEYAQWVLWKSWERNNKRTKIPVNAKTGENASVSDPSTWSTFELVVTVLNSNQYESNGIGFVFTSTDPYIGVDLDNCRNLETGEIEPWAQEIIRGLNTYTEISQSGKGLHCIANGNLLVAGKRKNSIEVYETGRYFVVTGNHLDGTPTTIEDRNTEIASLWKQVFGEENTIKQNNTGNLPVNKQHNSTDQELLARAIKAQNGAKFEQLWNGEAGEYQSNSEGDLALCGLLAFWTGKDPNRIDKLFRQSERYRPKWDAKHFSDGKTYGQATIEKAILETKETYTPKIQGSFVSSVSEVDLENKNIEWADLQPLPEDLLPVPKMIPELIPLPYREWIRDISERMQCPIEFPTVGAIIASASVIGNTISIRPKRHDDWFVVANLWGAIVGRPGILKTPALTEALKPLYRLAAKAKEEFNLRLKDYQFNQLLLEAKKKKLTDDLKKAIKNSQTTDHLREQLIEDDKEPREKRYVVNDSSVEKLGELLNQNPKGLLLCRDELIGWFQSLDRDGREGDRAFFLETWNGYGSYVFDRISRGTIHILSLTLSMIGGIQPGPLSSYLYHTLSGGMKDDGLLQRFQLIVYPDITKEWINVDRWPDNDAKNRVYNLFKSLDQLEPAHIGASIDLDSKLAYLRYEDNAQAFFDEWRMDLEVTLRSNKIEHPALEAHLSKYRSLMPSLSLIFHLIDYCDGKTTKTNSISLHSAQLAAAWCSFLLEHAKRIYGIAIRSEIRKAKTIANYLQKSNLPDPFTVRDIYRRGWSGLTTPQDCSEPLELLEDLNWIKSSRLPSTNDGGRPTIIYRINPKLKECSNEKLF